MANKPLLTTEEAFKEYGFKSLKEWIVSRFLWNREAIIGVKLRSHDISNIFLGILASNHKTLTDSCIRYLAEDIHAELRRLGNKSYYHNGKKFRLKSEGIGANQVYWMEEIS